MNSAAARDLVRALGLTDRVAKVVADAPDLSQEQRESLRALLRPLNVTNAGPDSRRSPKPGDVTSDASAG
jgi:hypothetical protein